MDAMQDTLDSGGRLHLPAADIRDVAEALDHLGTIIRELSEALTHELARRQAKVHHTAGRPARWEPLEPDLEVLLDAAPRDVSLMEHAQLAFLSVLTGAPEAIAVQVAFGPQMSLDLARVLEGLALHADFVPIFYGTTPNSPQIERIRRGIVLLRLTAALVPASFRPGLLCVIGWLYWALGRRVISLAYLAEATRIEPQHALAQALTELAESRSPAWISLRTH